MKKKLTALLLVCAMTISYGSMPVYADNLVEVEFIEEQDYPDNIIPTDKETAGEGCLLAGVQGTYLADAQNALDLINQYRKEACENGYPDPRNENRKLTASDYTPIKWSSDLEYIARIRAAEASILTDHTRPNGEMCFSLKSPNNIGSYGEVLAWNFSKSMLNGIEQWYDEKQDWLDQNSNAVTGHYTQMIDPDNTYVGIAAFLNENGVYPNTTSGEFTSQTDLDEDKAPAIENCTQIIEVQKSDVTASITGLEESVEAGYAAQAVYQLVDNNCILQYISDVTGGDITWSSSDPSIATVDQNGNVTAVASGTVTISAKTDCGLDAVYALTVSNILQKPVINKVDAKCASDGLNITWQASGSVSGYDIFKSCYKNGQWEDWELVKEVTDASITKWKDKDVDSSTCYRYTVIGYNAAGMGDYVNQNIAETYFVPKPTTKLSNGTKGITVSWTKSGNASGYYIYRKEKKSDSWAKVKTVDSKTTSWTDTSAKAGKSYYYTVVAYRNKSRSTYDTECSMMRLERPEVGAANAAKGSKISWKKIAGAQKYDIYCSQYSDKKWSKWTKIATVKKDVLTYTDTTAKEAKTYKYTVRAVNGKSQSAYESGKELYRLNQPDFTVSSTSKGISVKLKANKNIDGYWIYKKDSKGKWQRAATVKANKASAWTDTDVKKNKTYTYTVRAYKKKNISSYHAGKSVVYKGSK